MSTLPTAIGSAAVRDGGRREKSSSGRRSSAVRALRRPQAQLMLGTIAILLGVLSACHAGAGAATAPQDDADGRRPGSATQAPYDKSIAFLKLQQIEPTPSLPAAATKTAETSPRALRQIEEAQSLFEEDRYIEAMQQLERALRFSPNSLRAHQMMGRVCLEAGNTARAHEHLAKALQIQEDGSATHYLLGRAYSTDGLWRKALAQYRTLALCPDLNKHYGIGILSHCYLAEALAELGYLTAAIEQYEQFTSAGRQSWPEASQAHLQVEAQLLLLSAHSARSALHERLGQPLQAAQAMSAASALDPKNPDLIMDEARLFRQARRFDSAAAAAKRLAKFDLGAALPLLVSIHGQAGQPKELVADLTSFADAHPDDDRIVQVLADAYLEQGKEDLAIRTLLDFMEAYPPAGATAVALSRLYARQQRWTESMNTIADVIDSVSDPDELLAQWLDELRASGRAGTLLREVAGQVRGEHTAPGRLLVIGRIASAVQDHDLAEQALKKCAQAAPDFIEAHLALAQLYLDRYRWHDAAAAAEKAIDTTATGFRAHRLLGQAYLGLDDYDRATTALNNAVRLNHSDIASLIALLEVYELSGKPRQFERQNRILLERDPTNAQALQNLVLLALGQRNVDQVRRYVRSMEGVPELQSLHRRFEAMITFRENRDQDAYVAELDEIIKAYPDDPDANMDLVGVYSADGRYDLARKQLQDIVSSNPVYFAAQDLLCGLRALELDYRWPIDNLEARLAIHPHRIQWQAMLVQFLLDDQQYDRAAEALTRFLQNPNLPAAARSSFQFDLLMSDSLADRLPEAISSLKNWIKDQPERSNLKQLLLLLLHRDGESGRAVQLAEEWYRASSLSDRNLYQELLVRALWAAERHADAEILLLDWLEIDPEAVFPTNLLIVTMRRAERTADAIELAQALYTTAPTLEVFRSLWRLYVETRDFDTARRLIRDRMSAESSRRQRAQPPTWEEHTLRLWLSDVLISAEEYDAAAHNLKTWLQDIESWRQVVESRRQNVESRRQAVELDSKRFESLRKLSGCYQLAGKPSLSMKTLEEVYRFFPEKVGINNDLGYTWADTGVHLAEAEQMIRKAVASSPRSAQYLDSLGWVLYKKGDFASAHEWLVRATRVPLADWGRWLTLDGLPRGKDDAVIQDHLGDAAWRLNNKDQARVRWQRSYELLLETPEDERTPDQLTMLERVPAKIQAAEQGLQPQIAKALTDD